MDLQNLKSKMPSISNGSSCKLTVERARKLIDEMERQPLLPGDTWCLISHSWWMRLMELKDNLGSDEIIAISPINNEVLTRKTIEGYELKPKLAESLNYVFVPEKIFTILKHAFGVDVEERDVIKRNVIEGKLLQKQVFIEVYPVEVKVAHFKQRDHVILLKISQAETIEKVCLRAMDELSIPIADRNSVRFLVEEDGRFVELSSFKIDQSSMNEIVLSGTVIYIDSGELDNRLNESTTKTMLTRRASSVQLPGRSRGLCGLYNLGNTCFMNSALQCLSNVPELTQYFLSGEYLNEINEENVLGSQGRLARAYGHLMNEMWADNAQVVKPNKLKSVIGEIAPRFNGYSQQDSQELTSFLLDGLHEDLNRIRNKPYIEEKEDDTTPHELRAQQAWADYKKRNDSVVVDLLHGQLKSTVVCPVCEKVSVKFDPFCFLSVPVPSKERQTVSVITLVRKDKWAKFAITHSNKATAAQAIAEIKRNLQLPDPTKIVLLTSYAFEILESNAVLVPSVYALSTSKNFYAYIVEEGPLVVVENKSSIHDRILGVPLVVNFPGNGKSLSRKMVLDSILPIVYERLCKKPQSDNVEMTANNNENEENIPVQKVTLENCQLFEIIFYCDKKYTCLPTNVEESVLIPKDSAMDFKIVLRWKTSENFHTIDISRLVDREMNLMKPMKKCYPLNECFDLFTSQEQLDQNDSWYCPRCKKHEQAYKKLDLWKLPKILIVHLKRFHYSRYSRDKIDTEIIIPTRNFDLSKKLIKPNEMLQKYDLIAVSNHSGGLGSGHYKTLALNDDCWVEFNDTYVTQTRNTKRSMPETIASREAYILFYRRQDQGDSAAENGNTNKTETNIKLLDNTMKNSSSKQNLMNGIFGSTTPTRVSTRQSGGFTQTSSNEFSKNEAINSSTKAVDSSPSKRRPSESMKMEVDSD